MKRILQSCCIFIALLLLAACTTTTPPTAQPMTASSRAAIDALIAANSGREEALAEALLASLSLEQKAGQIMVIGMDGPEYDARCRDTIERLKIGGVILFARNITSPVQTAQLTQALQNSALENHGIGLFIAIDQEGGRVARLSQSKGFTEFPGAMALAATSGDVREAAVHVRRTAEAMAREMRAVGINVDFAPDLDVNNNPSNPVIGIRSFGSDPKRVAVLGTAFIEGLQSQGVLAFGKHFPGHGDTGTDSHVSLPVVSHDRARLEAVEFVPFKAAIAAQVAGIMSAHISFPTIEPTQGLPATLSQRVLTRLLREELGFKGLIITDSLEMGALAKHGYPAERAAALALAAGSDLLLFNAGHALHQAAHREIVAAVRSGAIPSSRLDQAVKRVLLAKIRHGVLRPQTANGATASATVGTPAHAALSGQLTARAITLVADPSHLLPLRGKTVVIGGPAATELAKFLGTTATAIAVADRPSPSDIDAALRAVRDNPDATVVLTLIGANGNRAQAALATAVLGASRSVVLVALRDPYDLLLAGQAGTAKGSPALIATYGIQPSPIRALADLLLGKERPKGRLPVDLPGREAAGTGLDSFAR